MICEIIHTLSSCICQYFHFSKLARKLCWTWSACAKADLKATGTSWKRLHVSVIIMAFNLYKYFHISKGCHQSIRNYKMFINISIWHIKSSKLTGKWLNCLRYLTEKQKEGNGPSAMLDLFHLLMFQTLEDTFKSSFSVLRDVMWPSYYHGLKSYFVSNIWGDRSLS